jgi:hypothetical protein
MVILDEIVNNWQNDQTDVVSIELLFRRLKNPLAGIIEDHHALMFSFSDGDYLTAEYGDTGIGLLYTRNTRPKIRAYENIMGKAEAKIEVYCLNEAFDKKAFNNIKLCVVFGVIEKIQEKYKPADYSTFGNNCQFFVKDILFLLNGEKYPFFIAAEFLRDSSQMNLPRERRPSYPPESAWDLPESRGGYKLKYLNYYYSGYWDINGKKFVEKWSCAIL